MPISPLEIFDMVERGNVRRGNLTTEGQRMYNVGKRMSENARRRKNDGAGTPSSAPTTSMTLSRPPEETFFQTAGRLATAGIVRPAGSLVAGLADLPSSVAEMTIGQLPGVDFETGRFTRDWDNWIRERGGLRGTADEKVAGFIGDTLAHAALFMGTKGLGTAALKAAGGAAAKANQLNRATQLAKAADILARPKGLAQNVIQDAALALPAYAVFEAPKEPEQRASLGEFMVTSALGAGAMHGISRLLSRRAKKAAGDALLKAQQGMRGDGTQAAGDAADAVIRSFRNEYTPNEQQILGDIVSDAEQLFDRGVDTSTVDSYIKTSVADLLQQKHLTTIPDRDVIAADVLDSAKNRFRTAAQRVIRNTENVDDMPERELATLIHRNLREQGLSKDITREVTRDVLLNRRNTIINDFKTTLTGDINEGIKKGLTEQQLYDDAMRLVRERQHPLITERTVDETFNMYRLRHHGSAKPQQLQLPPPSAQPPQISDTALDAIATLHRNNVPENRLVAETLKELEKTYPNVPPNTLVDEATKAWSSYKVSALNQPLTLEEAALNAANTMFRQGMPERQVAELLHQGFAQIRPAADNADELVNNVLNAHRQLLDALPSTAQARQTLEETVWQELLTASGGRPIPDRTVLQLARQKASEAGVSDIDSFVRNILQRNQVNTRNVQHQTIVDYVNRKLESGLSAQQVREDLLRELSILRSQGVESQVLTEEFIDTVLGGRGRPVADLPDIKATPDIQQQPPRPVDTQQPPRPVDTQQPSRPVDTQQPLLNLSEHDMEALNKARALERYYLANPKSIADPQQYTDILTTISDAIKTIKDGRVKTAIPRAHAEINDLWRTRLFKGGNELGGSEKAILKQMADLYGYVPPKTLITAMPLSERDLMARMANVIADYLSTQPEAKERSADLLEIAEAIRSGDATDFMLNTLKREKLLTERAFEGRAFLRKHLDTVASDLINPNITQHKEALNKARAIKRYWEAKQGSYRDPQSDIQLKDSEVRVDIKDQNENTARKRVEAIQESIKAIEEGRTTPELLKRIDDMWQHRMNATGGKKINLERMVREFGYDPAPSSRTIVDALSPEEREAKALIAERVAAYRQAQTFESRSDKSALEALAKRQADEAIETARLLRAGEATDDMLNDLDKQIKSIERSNKDKNFLAEKKTTSSDDITRPDTVLPVDETKPLAMRARALSFIVEDRSVHLPEGAKQNAVDRAAKLTQIAEAFENGTATPAMKELYQKELEKVGKSYLDRRTIEYTIERQQGLPDGTYLQRASNEMEAVARFLEGQQKPNAAAIAEIRALATDLRNGSGLAIEKQEALYEKATHILRKNPKSHQTVEQLLADGSTLEIQAPRTLLEKTADKLTRPEKPVQQMQIRPVTKEYAPLVKSGDDYIASMNAHKSAVEALKQPNLDEQTVIQLNQAVANTRKVMDNALEKFKDQLDELVIVPDSSAGLATQARLMRSLLDKVKTPDSLAKIVDMRNRIVIPDTPAWDYVRSKLYVKDTADIDALADTFWTKLRKQVPKADKNRKIITPEAIQNLPEVASMGLPYDTVVKNLAGHGFTIRSQAQMVVERIGLQKGQSITADTIAQLDEVKSGKVTAKALVRELEQQGITVSGNTVSLYSGIPVPEYYKQIKQLWENRVTKPTYTALDQVGIQKPSLPPDKMALLDETLQRKLRSYDSKIGVINQRLSHLAANTANFATQAKSLLDEREVLDKLRNSIRPAVDAQLGNAAKGKYVESTLNKLNKSPVDNHGIPYKDGTGQLVGYTWTSPIKEVKYFIPREELITKEHEHMWRRPVGMLRGYLSVVRDVLGEPLVRHFRAAEMQYSVFTSEYAKHVEKLMKPLMKDDNARKRVTMILQGDTIDTATKQEREIAAELRKIYDDLHKKFGFDESQYIKDYAPRFKKAPPEPGQVAFTPVDELPSTPKFSPEEKRVAEDPMYEYEDDAFAAIIHYIHSGARKKFFEPAIMVTNDILNHTQMHPSRQRVYKMFVNNVLGRDVWDGIAVDNFVDNVLRSFTKIGKQHNVAREASVIMTHLLYSSTLGGNVKSVMNNFTQLFLSMGGLDPNPAKGIKALYQAIVDVNTPQGKDLLEHAWILQNRAYVEGMEKINKFTGAIHKMNDWAMAGIRETDKINVRLSYLMKLRHALENGATYADAVNEANMFAGATQFLYGVDSPVFLKTSVGRVVGVFASWPINWMRLMGRYLFKEGGAGKAKFLSTLALSGLGAKALGAVTGFDFSSTSPADAATSWLPVAFLTEGSAASMPLEMLRDTYTWAGSMISGSDTEREEASQAMIEQLSNFVPFHTAGKRIVRAAEAAAKGGRLYDENDRYVRTMSGSEIFRSAISPTVEAREHRETIRELWHEDQDYSLLRERARKAFFEGDQNRFMQLQQEIINRGGRPIQRQDILQEIRLRQMSATDRQRMGLPAGYTPPQPTGTQQAFNWLLDVARGQ